MQKATGCAGINIIQNNGTPRIACARLVELAATATAIGCALTCAVYNPLHTEAEAGQVVFHAHFHVIPRNKDDKLLGLPKGGDMLEAAEAKKMAAKIVEHLDEPTAVQDAPSIMVPALLAVCAVLAGAIFKLAA